MRTIINILTRQLTQSELIKVIIAISDETAVASAINTVLAARESAWHDECRQLVADDRRISAIKACRNATGWTISESRDYVTENFPRLRAFDNNIPS
jgi:ribosomal protein L7/L12